MKVRPFNPMRSCLKSTEPGELILMPSAAMTSAGMDIMRMSVEMPTSSSRLKASCVSFDGVVVNVRKGMPSSSSSSMRATRFGKKFMATRVRMPSSSHIRKSCFISSSFLRVTAKTISSIGSANWPPSMRRLRSGTVPNTR